ncbi:MAG TPA: S9 family peptidase [Burkholderiaceae bacterium]
MPRPVFPFTSPTWQRLGLALTVLLAACAAPPAPQQVVTPNAQLLTQGMPPIPAQLAAETAKYTDFRAHTFVAWHPTRREMLVSHRPAGGSTTQLFRVASPMSPPKQLTDDREPVRGASYEPLEGRYVVFMRGTGGDEANQLYRLDLASRQTTLLTDPNERHSLEGWLHHSSRMLELAVPLDRTATNGTRERITQTLYLVDPMQPEVRRKLAELPGSGWDAEVVSQDDRRIALTRFLSAEESQIWLLDIASGALTQVAPEPGSTLKAAHRALSFTRDGSGLYVVTNRSGEFSETQLLRLADRTWQPAAQQTIPWDIDGGDASRDGRLLALQANADGRGELRLVDTATRSLLPAPAALPAGSIVGPTFHPQSGEIAFSVNSAQGPGQVYTLDPAGGRVEAWTRPAAAPGVDTRTFAEPRIVRWPSFDGRMISGILYPPPARFSGKRPVLVLIHGGPEGQAKLGFLGRYNFLVQELGIAVIQPNVRGSSGYGKTFLALDNGIKREDAVRDIGALFDWIGQQPDLDPTRVAVSGGSYGGYMSLAVATHYADRIAGAIDVVGISNFLTFLKNTESYRRDLRRVEYGDERDPAMREFLERISPLTNAAKITKPLFVVQGRNDPRVPYTEAEQIVAKARENGTPVWYLRAENEGHGFARKENADFEFYATVMFLRRTLLGEKL